MLARRYLLCSLLSLGSALDVAVAQYVKITDEEIIGELFTRAA